MMVRNDGAHSHAIGQGRKECVELLLEPIQNDGVLASARVKPPGGLQAIFTALMRAGRGIFRSVPRDMPGGEGLQLAGEQLDRISNWYRTGMRQNGHQGPAKRVPTRAAHPPVVIATHEACSQLLDRQDKLVQITRAVWHVIGHMRQASPSGPKQPAIADVSPLTTRRRCEGGLAA